MPTISLCMITCNEEDNIRRCLESAHGLADEIIIVDTGSKDRTKSICDEYGAIIYDYDWSDDFAAARNFSVSKASCDWILLLDADEELIISDPEGIRQHLFHTTYDLIPIRMTHFYGGWPIDEKLAHFSGALRLVRNDGAVRFTGGIHETLDAGNKTAYRAETPLSFIRILHYGYMDDGAGAKSDRNISLLLKEISKQPSSPWLHYHLAAEHYRTGRFSEAYSEVNAAIALFLEKKLKPPALSYKLKYDMLIASGYCAIALGGIDNALALYPDYVDLHFYKGILHYIRGEYDKARGALTYCLLLGEMNMEYLILSGCGSFLALYYLGLCYAKQGEAELSAEAIRQAKALCPKLSLAKKRFEAYENV